MNLLFDLDGTIIDPIEGFEKSIQYAFSKMNLPMIEDLESHIGPPLHVTFKKFLQGFPDDVYDETLALYREKYAEVGVVSNRLYSGIENLFFQCQQEGHKVFLATSKPRVFAEKILHNLSLEGFFAGVYGSELDGSLADKAELIHHIVETESLDKNQTVMIGDRKFDLIGADKNDIPAIAVDWGYGARSELAAYKPHAICSNTDELLQVIHGLSDKLKS